MTTEQPKPRMQRSRLLRLIVAIVVTIPLVISAIYMWALWDPTKKVDEMPVAIVNSDVGYGEGADRVDAGAGVANNLVESQSLGFKLVDEKAAYEGLRDGDYYFVIQIPEDFSESLANIATVTEAPALISVTFNDYNTLKASSIGGSAMEKIQQAVLKGVATTTVGSLVDGVQSLGDGLRTAADGSTQLADGTTTLREGIENELAPGVSQAAEGSNKLAAGAGTLSQGLYTLQAGTDTLGAGATQIADGIERLTGQIPLAQVEALLKQAQAVVPNSSQLATVSELIEGLQALKAGSRQVANELTDPNAQYRGGLNKLVDGGGQLASGANELSVGMGKLDAGVAKLADGARQLDEGAGKLSTGLNAGAEQAPDFGDQDRRTSLAALIATPVGKEYKHVAQAQFMGPGAMVVILIIITMLIPIVVFMSFRGHRFVTDNEAPRSVRDIARRGLAVVGISLVAVWVLAALVWFFMLSPSPNPVSLWQVYLITGAAVVMYVALISVLFTLFGYVVGAITSLAWMMLQLFSYGGIWMYQTVPAPFQWLYWISPMTLVQKGYTASFNGVSGFWPSFISMLVIAAVAAAITFAVVKWQNKRFHGVDAPGSGGETTEILTPTH